MSAAAPFRYRWFARGDINGFFALAIDNMAQLVAMAGILVGVFHLPPEIVLGRMVPGTAAGVLLGDLIYTWLAFRLARREGRQDVCAMPLGIDTPSLFALTFGVVGPAYLATHDGHQAWAIGMAVMVIMGVAKLIAAFFGEALRRTLPRAALLGSLGAVAIALIMFFPLTKLIVEPIGGFVGLGLVLMTLVGGRPLPFGFPAVIGALLASLLVYSVAGSLGYVPPPLPAATVSVGPAIPWPTLVFLDGLSAAWHYLPLAIPVAITTVIGGVDNTESAAVAGDRYDTRAILLGEGAATLFAALCGGVIQNTPYIGHPAYKDMGSRAGYTLATALAIGLGAASGFVGWLVALLPESVVVPVLVFIGLEMAGQSLRATDKRHSRAWPLVLVPVLANLVTIEIGGLLGAVGLDLARLPEEAQHNLLALYMLGNGFILTGMLWMTWMIWVIDGALGKAAAVAAIAAGLTLFGFMHSPFADGRLYLPWQPDLPPQIAALAVGYLLLAGLCLVFRAAPKARSTST